MAFPIPSVSTEGFRNASFYDKHRPSYPPDAVTRLLKNLHVHGVKKARVLDLAAGTGKFTELLAGRNEGFDILAVEPHSGMRGELEKKALTGVKVLEGEASSMSGVESQSVHAVIAAQAFHWFANSNTLNEIYRVLSPGGAFGMIWNIEDYNAPMSWKPATKWEGQLKDITWSFGNEDVRFRHEQWREVFEMQLRSTPLSILAAEPLFSLPLGEDSVGFTQWLNPKAIWDRYRRQMVLLYNMPLIARIRLQREMLIPRRYLIALSQVAVLEGKELGNMETRVLEIARGADVKRNKDGSLELHGRTFFAWSTAVPGAPLKTGG